ncbi:MAG: PDZ domain-containing protein [Verrucomicrobia bacterium]|nr:PDZ domain-containing protein [Verrucomicrobiota bacterium]
MKTSRIEKVVWTMFWTGLIAVLFLDATMVARGQAEQQPPAPKQTKADAANKQPEKWIGVRVNPLMPTTRSHLKQYLTGMPEDAGLAVSDVTEESPAVVAGIEKYDILLRADGQPLTKVETLQEMLTKRNFGTSVRIDLVHEGKPKTVHALVLERPEGAPGLNAGRFGGRGGPGGPGGPGGQGGPGGRGRAPFGGGNSTVVFTDADGKQQKVSGDQMGDFWRKMREDEKFRQAVREKGLTIQIAPEPAQPAGDAPPKPDAPQ